MAVNILIISNRPPQDALFPGSLRDLISEYQAGNLERAASLLLKKKPSAAIIDIDSFQEAGRGGLIQMVEAVRSLSADTKIIALTSGAVNSNTVKMKSNGAHCLALPTTYEKVNAAVDAAVLQSDAKPDAFSFIAPNVAAGYPTMVKTRSEIMRQMLEKVALVSRTETTVLLSGETGTGKGVIARLIHDSSPRNGRTMMNVHCGAIPDSLIESELFGHEKGSFTGAIKTNKGKFEQASRGTIFLDEIGTITAATQIKLLQVLQDRTFQPIGSQRTRSTDVRIIAASNSNLEEMANRGEFRRDLFYRLNIFPVEVPPLRKRKEDIGLFVEYFLNRFNEKHGKQIQGLTEEMLHIFEQYDWPGNVRELENLLERAHILADTPYLDRHLFPVDLCRQEQRSHIHVPFTAVKTLAETRNEAVRKVEQEYLCTLLSIHKGKIEATAKSAGVSRRQIHKLLTKYNIKKEMFKPDAARRR